jgi:transposase, IS5 family
VRLRQSYLRVAKRAAMMAGRYADAKQFNRHRRELRILRTRLGRLIRDIGRKIEGHADIEAAFALPLARANQIRSQQQRQRGWKLYSFHAPGDPEHRKGQVQRALRVRRQGLHRHHQRPRPRRPVRAATPRRVTYDGHTLRDVIKDTQNSPAVRSSAATSIRATAAMTGESAPHLHLRPEARRVRYHQTRIATPIRNRAVIGHLKAEGHLGRCYLKGRAGDATNAPFSAIGYNLRRILALLRDLLRLFLIALLRLLTTRSALNPAS